MDFKFIEIMGMTTGYCLRVTVTQGLLRTSSLYRPLIVNLIEFHVGQAIIIV